MQSRDFFGFGASFNIVTSSVFVCQNKLDSASLPSSATYLMTEDNKYLITQSSDKLIAN